MSESSIANFLKEIGQDDFYRKCFNLYLNYVDINTKKRIVYVIDLKNKIPPYFLIVTGNIINISILSYIIETLRSYNIKLALIDAENTLKKTWHI
ncbi:MAG: hypothetical protein LBE27_05720 [Deltaproteobacteria bacterium]|jgi:hypothetical protein|nr:hypothetical protein [Deltaproteobacteria bacterium]